MKARSFISIILLGSLLSCSEFLVVEPDNQVSIKEQFSTTEGIFQAVNGMYYDFEKFYTGKFFIYADLVGGNISFPPAENDRILEIPTAEGIDQVYEFRDLADDSDMRGIYPAAYEIINAANLILENTMETNLLTADEKDQLTAEALACRAITHYLVALGYAQHFGYSTDGSHPGIVYNTRTITAGVDYPSRLSIAESYQLMLQDLEISLSLFTGTPILPFGPPESYFHAMGTAGFAARIALQMNDWDNAWRFADTVIQHSGLSIMKDTAYIDEWEHPDASLSETVMELSTPKNSDGEPSNSVAHEHYIYTDVDNYASYVASGDLLDLYAENDIRRGMFLEALIPTSVNGILENRVYYFTRKFQAEKAAPVVRLSEMFLIRAEAEARRDGGVLSTARIDLNRLRFRAGLDPLVTDENLLEEIFLERRRELAFENFLLFDLARFKKGINREQDCISNVCSLTYPSDYFILPIPERSILLNEFMKQNDGY